MKETHRDTIQIVFGFSVYLKELKEQQVASYGH